MKANPFPWRTLVILLACAIFGVAASFPFVLSLYADKLANAPLPLPVVLGLALVQNTVLLGLMIGLGLLLTAKVGLPGTPLIDDWRAGRSIAERLRGSFQPALMTGLGVGVAVLVMFSLILHKEIPQLPIGKAAMMPVWKRFLLCFYGGLTEEIMMRIFVLSLLVWLLSRIWRSADGRKVFWAANILLAVLFGLGHLGSVIPLMPVTFNIVLGALLLNGVASIAFTSLYAKRGLEAAIIAHFMADFMIWVIGPSFILR